MASVTAGIFLFKYRGKPLTVFKSWLRESMDYDPEIPLMNQLVCFHVQKAQKRLTLF